MHSLYQLDAKRTIWLVKTKILDLMALLKDLNSEITTKNKNKTQNPTSYDIE